MFKIGDFSRLTRVPVSTLRYYADRGLLEPAHVDPYTSYRYFTLDQLPRLNRILALKDLGLSLEEIAYLLDGDLSAEQLRGMLRLKQAELSEEIQSAQARLSRVEARLHLIEMEGKMPEQEVIVKTLAPQEVLAIRQVVPTGEYVGHLLGESAGAIARQGVQFAGPPLIRFHDPEFKDENLDVEAVFPVTPQAPQEVALDEGRVLQRRRLPGVEQAACVLHPGDYADFPATYEALGRWIGDNGYQIAGPVREVYLRAPDQEGGALTEIQIPVEK